MILQALLLILSLIFIYYGAEFTLKASQSIGLYFGISPLVLGIFIVGVGTSLPEFFVSHFSSIRGEQGIAVGNIVGSNIANSFLILGVVGLISRLSLRHRDIYHQLIFHLIVTIIFCLILYFQGLFLWGSLLLGLFLVAYLFYFLRQMISNSLPEEDFLEKELPSKLQAVTVIKLIMGLGLLFGGGELLVSSGTKLSLLIGISSFVLAAILVAFGTSLPELAMAITVARKKMDTDFILGNILGSNLFNIAFVFFSLSPYTIRFTQNFYIEIVALIFSALALLFMSRMNKAFSTKSGLVFLCVYIAMVCYWFFQA